MPTPSTFARVRRTALAAALPLLLAVGCSDNPEPSAAATPTPSASPTADPSDSPVAPELPAAATENTPEGAEAFVRYWVEALNHATSSGETEPLRALSADECAGCRGVADGIERIYDAGGRISGGAWKVSNLSAIPAPEGRTSVDALITTTAQEVIESGGADPLEYAGAESFRVFTVAFSHHWRVIDIEEPS